MFCCFGYPVYALCFVVLVTLFMPFVLLFWLPCLCPLFCCSQYFKIIWLSNILTCERTWWRLFQKRVFITKFDIHVFITITGSISPLVDSPRWYHLPSIQCFGTNMDLRFLWSQCLIVFIFMFYYFMVLWVHYFFFNFALFYILFLIFINV